MERLRRRVTTSRKIFIDSKISLVHGDLVFHNLLTDKEKISGVLDWERALFGDPDFDIFRLMNFKLSASAYKDTGNDGKNETGYLSLLLSKIKSSGLIDDIEIFDQKYQIAKASYYLNALYWDAKSNDPQKNIQNTLKEIEKFC